MTIEVATSEEVRALRREVAELKAIVLSHVHGQPEWVDTAEALRLSGIRTRETLVRYKRADQPDTKQAGRIAWRKQGTKCQYLKSACIDYAQHKHGQPTLTAIAA